MFVVFDIQRKLALRAIGLLILLFGLEACKKPKNFEQNGLKFELKVSENGMHDLVVLQNVSKIVDLHISSLLESSQKGKEIGLLKEPEIQLLHQVCEKIQAFSTGEVFLAFPKKIALELLEPVNNLLLNKKMKLFCQVNVNGEKLKGKIGFQFLGHFHLANQTKKNSVSIRQTAIVPQKQFKKIEALNGKVDFLDQKGVCREEEGLIRFPIETTGNLHDAQLQLNPSKSKYSLCSLLRFSRNYKYIEFPCKKIAAQHAKKEKCNLEIIATKKGQKDGFLKLFQPLLVRSSIISAFKHISSAGKARKKLQPTFRNMNEVEVQTMKDTLQTLAVIAPKHDSIDRVKEIVMLNSTEEPCNENRSAFVELEDVKSKSGTRVIWCRQTGGFDPSNLSETKTLSALLFRARIYVHESRHLLGYFHDLAIEEKDSQPCAATAFSADALAGIFRKGFVGLYEHSRQQIKQEITYSVGKLTNEGLCGSILDQANIQL